MPSTALFMPDSLPLSVTKIKIFIILPPAQRQISQGPLPERDRYSKPPVQKRSFNNIISTVPVLIGPVL